MHSNLSLNLKNLFLNSLRVKKNCIYQIWISTAVCMSCAWVENFPNGTYKWRRLVLELETVDCIPSASPELCLQVKSAGFACSSFSLSWQNETPKCHSLGSETVKHKLFMGPTPLSGLQDKSSSNSQVCLLAMTQNMGHLQPFSVHILQQ